MCERATPDIDWRIRPGHCWLFGFLLVFVMPELLSLYICLHSVYPLWFSLLVSVQNTLTPVSSRWEIISPNFISIYLTVATVYVYVYYLSLYCNSHLVIFHYVMCSSVEVISFVYLQYVSLVIPSFLLAVSCFAAAVAHFPTGINQVSCCFS